MTEERRSGKRRYGTGRDGAERHQAGREEKTIGQDWTGLNRIGHDWTGLFKLNPAWNKTCTEINTVSQTILLLRSKADSHRRKYFCENRKHQINHTVSDNEQY